MNIGMTFDLKSDYLSRGYDPELCAEFDSERTIEAIEEALAALGHMPERIGSVRDLVDALAAGRRWELVFNIAEGLWGTGREAQVPALLDAYRIPYTFAGPLCLCATLDKGVAKRLVRDHGLPTPDFAVAEQPEDLARVNLPWPLFVKPLAEGTGKGVTAASRVENRAELLAEGTRLLAAFGQPVIAETYLPGREVTVGVVGTGAAARSVGVMEVHLRANADPGVYSYQNKELFKERVDYALVHGAAAQEAAELAVACYRALGCRDGGRVDLRAGADGRFSFLEVNPLAGLHPEHSDLPILCALGGMGYGALIREILDSALARVARERRVAA